LHFKPLKHQKYGTLVSVYFRISESLAAFAEPIGRLACPGREGYWERVHYWWWPPIELIPENSEFRPVKYGIGGFLFRGRWSVWSVKSGCFMH